MRCVLSLTPFRGLTWLILLGAGLCLTGCYETSSIQSEYISKRDDCNDDAEEYVYELNEKKPLPEAKQTSAKKAYLNTCLNRQGWKLAPKPASKSAPKTSQAAPSSNAAANRATIQPIAVPIIITQPVLTPLPYAVPTPSMQAPATALPPIDVAPPASAYPAPQAPAYYIPAR